MRQTRFIPGKLKLIINGFPHHPAALSLLQALTEAGIVSDVYTPDRRRRLELVLANPGHQPATTVLCQFAYALSVVHNGRHRAVYSPWTVRGRAVNINLAVDLIGDVFRMDSAPAPRRRPLPQAANAR